MSRAQASGFDSAGVPTPAPALVPRPSGLLTGPEGLGPSYLLRVAGAVVVLAAIATVTEWLYHLPGRGAPTAFSLLIGAALGVIMQRGRFCFYCIFSDLIEKRDSRPFYAILTSLAVGSVCYTVIYTAFMPTPTAGRFPPDAHIGPVSWALVLAGIAFGLGMALSGACISGHLYRLGEGYTRAPFALAGAIVGFGAGFFSWRTLYLSAISKAPVPWLPHYLGYGGAIIAQCLVIGGIAIVLLRYLPQPPGTGSGGSKSSVAVSSCGGQPVPLPPSLEPAMTASAQAGDCSATPDALVPPDVLQSSAVMHPPSALHPCSITPPSSILQPSSVLPSSSILPPSSVLQPSLSIPSPASPKEAIASVWRRVFVDRWSPGATGTAVGVLGALAYFRVAPLGVTSQLGSIARTWLTDAGLLAGRLNGLDAFRGCVTVVIHTISDNGVLVSGLVAASFAMALTSGRFKLSKLTAKGAVTALLGGVLMGWGSMIALGCTVGTLLSGIMALSLSGWVFFASVLAGVWGGLKLGLHRV